MQYGFDSSGIGGLQAMPGFLKIYGLKDPGSPMGYGIDVRLKFLLSLYSGFDIRLLIHGKEYCPATNIFPAHLGLL